MTIQEAKNLKIGQLIYSTHKKNADGTPMRAKVLSVKTWKRSPEKVLVSVKHGLYDYVKFNKYQLDEITNKEKDSNE